MSGGRSVDYKKDLLSSSQEFCCESLQSLDGDLECPLKYIPYQRAYVLSIPSYYLKKNTLCPEFQISHCPWCGAQLPKNLSEEWYSIIKEKFGITDFIESEIIKQLPEEFQTAAWWKKRGL